MDSNHPIVAAAVEAMCAAEGDWPPVGPMRAANAETMAARRDANRKRLAAAIAVVRQARLDAARRGMGGRADPPSLPMGGSGG